MQLSPNDTVSLRWIEVRPVSHEISVGEALESRLDVARAAGRTVEAIRVDNAARARLFRQGHPLLQIGAGDSFTFAGLPGVTYRDLPDPVLTP